MSISQVFIDHPRVAFVLSILIAFCGGLCLNTIPVAEYPEIAPTTIYVTASYPGASSEVIAETVAIPIEDQINAVDDLLYFSSSCNNNGSYACYVTFRSGTDSNMNLVNLQNAVKRAEPKLPSEVLAKGLTVNKRQEDRMAMYVFLTDGRQVSIMDLCNFVENDVKDAVQRLPGVSLVDVSNRKYAMRVWLNPVRMTGMGVTIFDIKNALQAQNVQAAAGTIGSEYSNRYLSYKLNVKGRLKTKEEFENIVVRANPETGAQVLLKDVARVELGAKTYSSTNRFNDDMAIFLNVYKSPEANAIETVKSVKAEVEKWVGRLPPGVKCILADDTTAFTKVFMKETAKTLVVALLLVVLITYLFLQDWRATFVPAIAIPIPHPRDRVAGGRRDRGGGEHADPDGPRGAGGEGGGRTLHAADHGRHHRYDARDDRLLPASRVLPGHGREDVRAVRGDDVRGALPLHHRGAHALAGPVLAAPEEAFREAAASRCCSSAGWWRSCGVSGRGCRRRSSRRRTEDTSSRTSSLRKARRSSVRSTWWRSSTRASSRYRAWSRCPAPRARRP